MKKEYAAIEMLPFSWRNATKVDRNELLGYLRRYQADGTLHKWAILDFVFGNPDRHGQNVMVSPEGEMKLIDHGSAFAGANFDPAHDENSFVPFYLRASAPEGEFNRIEPERKLRYMPTISPQAEKGLREWVDGIDEARIAQILQQYGVDPTWSMKRLQQLRGAKGPMDMAINRLWVTV